MLSTTTMLRLSPYASLYDEDGSYIQYPMDSDINAVIIIGLVINIMI